MADRKPPIQSGSDSQLPRSSLDLSAFPPFFILDTHLTSQERYEAENRVRAAGGMLAETIHDAQIIMCAINSMRRARFELQVKDVKLDASPDSSLPPLKRVSDQTFDHSPVESKRRRRSAGDLPGHRHGNDDEHDKQNAERVEKTIEESTLSSFLTLPGLVMVVKLSWLNDSADVGTLLSVDDYLLYEGVNALTSDKTLKDKGTRPSIASLLGRSAGESAEDRDPSSPRTLRGSSSPESESHPKPRRIRPSQHSGPPKLQRATTFENEDKESVQRRMPKWAKENKVLSCERPTPMESPNNEFIRQLEQIKQVRLLTLDEIGVRAYSTSIASIAAYPTELISAQEILALPGCDQKIAQLFREFQERGTLGAAEELEKDPKLVILNSFSQIWGVGPKTALEFYHEKGWREINDIIDCGWHSLSSEQQIGLKYLEDFQRRISRAEVEYIASIVTYHARQLVEDGDGIECAIVGGYRRGKKESGDVDLVLSHKRLSATSYLIKPLTIALANSGWITHVLKISETNSSRGQDPLPNRVKQAPGGFDTLDKALVVWQDPTWPTKFKDLEDDPNAKNPNVHRRVDIIVSPWRTVGCAVAGWSSGTTFQRDMRRHTRKTKNWKFDSSGVRDRASGRWIDLEKWSNEETRATSWQEAEKRVFEGLGLEWFEPSLRCTH